MDTDDSWAEYARLSKQADSDQLNDRAWAADEALNEVLNRIATKRVTTRAVVANLVRNRTRKYRNRRLILAANAVLFPTEIANDNARHDALDALRRSATVLTSFEARLLFAIARGETYGELARLERVPTGTMKTWIRRARLKLQY